MSDHPARPTSPAAPTSEQQSALTPVSGVDSGEIARLQERVAFYESFDELIQQSISRANQMIQEAATRREEASATIERARSEQARERDGQRAVLAELLDDVMTIQQATERLAHRVSEALEQVEFLIEPTGLPSTERLTAGAFDALGTGPARTEAENVRDEVSAGAFATPTSAPSTGALPSFHSNGGASDNIPSEPVVVPGDDLRADTVNPETAETEPADAPADAPQSLSDHVESAMIAEPTPGEGEEASPVESSAETWVDQDEVSSGATTTPDGMVGGAADTAVTTAPSETGTEPEGMTGPDDGSDDVVIGEQPLAISEDETEASQPSREGASADDLDLAMTEDESVSVAADDSAQPSTGSDVEISQETPVSPPSSPVAVHDNMRGENSTPAETAAQATVATPANALASAASRSASHPSSSQTPTTPTEEPSASTEESASPPVEQRTTLIMNGVPRAAVALSIQRHILSQPEVLRAEVREYYDHRLTLSVTSERLTTIDDLSGWDPTADWEMVTQGDGELEVRLIM